MKKLLMLLSAVALSASGVMAEEIPESFVEFMKKHPGYRSIGKSAKTDDVDAKKIFADHSYSKHTRNGSVTVFVGDGKVRGFRVSLTVKEPIDPKEAARLIRQQYPESQFDCTEYIRGSKVTLRFTNKRLYEQAVKEYRESLSEDYQP